jgi:hypothetical protein
MLKSMKNVLRNIFSPSKKTLFKDWNFIKTSIDENIQKNNIEQAIGQLCNSCEIAYEYNFIDSYTDKQIENYIQDIGKNIINNLNLNSVSKEENIMFFDFFSLENRGFTQQYLEAFQLSDKKLIYVLENESQYNNGANIIRSVEEKNGIVRVLSQENRIAKIKSFANLIIEHKPSKIFFHTAPWELTSSIVASQLVGSNIKTYLINITDHAYWPGIDCFENIIDFRQYGHYVNKQIKNKNSDNLFIIPTPPYIDNKTKFDEFSVNCQNKVIGYGGGSLYKIRDKKNTYLNLINVLIKQNPNFIFLFSDIGNNDFLNKFISENGLEKQFILIGNRQDISQVIANIDIFINTYPYGGGLMVQYALYHKKPVLALRDEGLVHTHIENIIDRDIKPELKISNKNDFIDIGNKLIREASFMTEMGRNNYESLFSFDVFNQKILNLLNGYTEKKSEEKQFAINNRAISRFHNQALKLRKYNYYKKFTQIYQHKDIKYYWYRALSLLMKA